MPKKKPTRKFVSLSEGEKAYAMSRAVVQGDKLRTLSQIS